MASILDRYGIKEVADVTFYHLDNSGKPDYPVLYLDTLKVSTIEQTAETSEARGGKGNGLLILWDYGKEINVTLEDALFSAKSMAIMFGGGNLKTTNSSASIMRTEIFTATSDTTVTTNTSGDWDATSATAAGFVSQYQVGNKVYNKVNPKFYENDATGATVNTSNLTAGTKYLVTYDLVINGQGQVIEISADTFPGVYYVTGDTYARNEANGEDEFFQFIIPKAKVLSENTITLEAEGDPTVFNMNLRVLRPDNGVMMKLVKYDLVGDTAGEGTTSDIVHNHDLTTAQA